CENRNPSFYHFHLTIRSVLVDLELLFLDSRLRGNDELNKLFFLLWPLAFGPRLSGFPLARE
ncbi:MAG: hypothetical protein KAX11_01595, partial [Candidatus Aminicenantes bacterium]|nr:hypothetical protein [Candidatus Aminicenantes bacterium]